MKGVWKFFPKLYNSRHVFNILKMREKISGDYLKKIFGTYKGVLKDFLNEEGPFYIGIMEEDSILIQTYEIEKNSFRFARNLIFQSYKNRLLYTSVGIALIRQSDKEVMGYFIIDEIVENIYFISVIVVRKQYRNRKIGTFLMNVLLKIFHDVGGRILYLTIPKNSSTIKNFYKSFGFFEFNKLKVNEFYDDIKKLQDILSRQIKNENVSISVEDIDVKKGIIKSMYGGVDGIILVRIGVENSGFSQR